jgi:hypothetical protein
MILDSTLFFTAAPPGDAITAGGASSHIIDLLGVGSGNASTNRIGLSAGGVFGEDLGTGPGAAIPTLANFITVALAPGTASLNIQFQGAPDNGSNVPGTWTTYAESGPVLASGIVAPGRIFPIDWPWRVLQNTPLPRFIRLNYAVTGGPFTGGSIFSGIGLAEDLYTFYPANYTAAA